MYEPEVQHMLLQTNRASLSRLISRCKQATEMKRKAVKESSNFTADSKRKRAVKYQNIRKIATSGL